MTDEHLGGSGVQPDRDDGDAGVSGDNGVVVQEDSVDHAGDPGQTEGPPTAEPAPVPAGADSPAVPVEPMDESELLAELASDKLTMPMIILAMGGRFFDCKDSELTFTMKVNNETMEGRYALMGDTVQEGEDGVKLMGLVFRRKDVPME